MPYKWLRKRVTSVTVGDNGERGCGAGIRTPTSWSRARRPAVRRPRNGGWSVPVGLRGLRLAELEPVRRHEPLFRLRVDAGDHVDVRLEPRAAQLRLQEAVDLVDARRVVHDDLDGDGSCAAVGDPDLVDGGGRERVDGDRAALEGDPRATLGEIERVGD